MATQYDILWREDILQKWDFYDLSQSLEFQKRGYKVVVHAAEKSWCIHDCGIMNLSHYFKERKIFLKEYGDIMENTRNESFDVKASGHMLRNR